ncbi:Glycosyltransferase involved in cell wall bisynthesis [Sphaerochaeta associata]|uniref:Glycosyltransferase n=1 Tax=Sphaerochaeta associata TaxID=1129264 RepID=A0ABY4DBA0_9SPIR|nr:glycosyltransferase [Sphaerochaeta associata]UOM51558.1 glycosyltransferase [Sphaerochaeta associata]SMP66243.1 Glycosyltransferase involved in cell wall bisynthesis [Sphaerochaeta associata]
MKIVIVCFTYSPSFSYMENQLAKAFQVLGHNVSLIASTESYVQDKIERFSPGDYVYDNLAVKRISFAWKGNYLAHKLWKMKGLSQALEDFQPDIIYHMNICGLEIKNSVIYVNHNPKTTIFFDNHAAFYNSGKNWVSKYLRYQLILGNYVRRASEKSMKIFYIGNGEKYFLENNFHIPTQKLELFPLGDFILSDDQYLVTRKQIRTQNSVSNECQVICHTGKLNKSKYTIEIINSFLYAGVQDSQLWIIGGIENDIYDDVMTLIHENSDRIKYFGWKNSSQLSELLCACDIYVQLSVSSTFLTALCRKCVGVSINPVDTYNYIPKEIYYQIATPSCLKHTLKKILDFPGQISSKRQESYIFAKDNLDYLTLVDRLILQPHANKNI